MNSFWKTVLWNWVVYLCFLLVLCLVYSSALLVDYGYHDDYFWFEYAGPFHEHPHHSFAIGMGRIGQALFLDAAGWIVRSLADLKIVRFISVFNLSLCAIIFYLKLKACFPRPILAFFFTAGFFTLPTFQVYAGYANTIFMSFALLFASLSAWFVGKSSLSNPWWAWVAEGRLWVGFFLLLFSVFTYQSAAMFYWPFVAAIILFQHQLSPKKFWRFLVKHFCVGFGAMGVYALILKKMAHRYAEDMSTAGMYNPYTLTTAYGEKLKWFFTDPIRTSMNLWNISPFSKIWLVLAVFLAVTVVFTFCRVFYYKRILKQPISLNRIVLHFGLVVILLFLCYLPNLVSLGFPAFYRTYAALFAMIFLVLLWALDQWLSLFPIKVRNTALMIILFLCFFWGAFQAHRTVYFSRVLPSSLEIRCFIESLRGKDFSKYSKVYVIAPVRRLFELHARYDEMAVLTSYFKQDIVRMMMCATQELGIRKDMDIYRPELFNGPSYPKNAPDDKTIYVDLRKIFRAERNYKFIIPLQAPMKEKSQE